MAIDDTANSIIAGTERLKGAYEQALARKEKKPERVLVAKAKSRAEDRQIEHESRVQAIERVGEVLPLLDAYYDSAAEHSRGLESPLESVVMLGRGTPGWDHAIDWDYAIKFKDGTLEVRTHRPFYYSGGIDYVLRVWRARDGNKKSTLTIKGQHSRPLTSPTTHPKGVANSSMINYNYDIAVRITLASIGAYAGFAAVSIFGTTDNVTPEQIAILLGSVSFGAVVTASSDRIAQYACQAYKASTKLVHSFPQYACKAYNALAGLVDRISARTVEVEKIPFKMRGYELLSTLNKLEWFADAIPAGIEKALNDYGRKPQPALKSGG